MPEYPYASMNAPEWKKWDSPGGLSAILWLMGHLKFSWTKKRPDNVHDREKKRHLGCVIVSVVRRPACLSCQAEWTSVPSCGRPPPVRLICGYAHTHTWLDGAGDPPVLSLHQPSPALSTQPIYRCTCTQYPLLIPITRQPDNLNLSSK